VKLTFGPGCPPLSGEVGVPGDKSLSHRAVLFAAMAVGTSRVEGVLDSADVRSTISAVTALGARVELAVQGDGSLAGEIEGWGAAGPSQPSRPIDCGNSGTTCRLLMGVLAGYPIEVTLVGDASLSRRPMRRVTDPLSHMGASFQSAEMGTLPITMRGARPLTPLQYDSPIASAQVKTAILLAGLSAQGTTRVTEPALSRDHTERLLPAFGVEISADPDALECEVLGIQTLTATDLAVPRDPSSAAFLAVAASLVPGSRVSMPGVSLNETRTGFLRVLQRMGASVRITDAQVEGAEPLGTLVVEHGAQLHSTVVTPAEVPSLVDEVPVLALFASQARGTTRFEGVGELRVKESDRLAAIAEGLDALGVTARSGHDWLEVDGPVRLRTAELDSLGDHRLAMTWALAGLVGDGAVTVDRFEAVSVSYPGFSAELSRLAGVELGS
jgi:3-phosphoshikimate 1-carboxyvinyltransferase